MPIAASQYLNFHGWYTADPVTRIQACRTGVPSSIIRKTAKLLNLTPRELTRTLGLSYAAIARKIKNQKPLNPAETESIVGMFCLIGQVKAIADKNIGEDFDSVKWFSSWIWEPLPALSGTPAAEYLDTNEGRKLISRILGAAESGVYL
ncbi:MAG: DUF2384 domain-containing protein [Spongiibacteraceae bacterium]